MFQPYIEMSWFLAKYTILFAPLPQVITISQNIFYHWCINCSYFSRCLLLCKHMLTLLLQSLLCPHSRFPVKFIQFSLLFWSHALPRALRKNLAIFSVCLRVRLSAFLPAGVPACPVYAVRSQAARHLHRVFLPQRPRHCGLAAARKFDPCNFIPASPPCPAPSFCTHFKTAKGHLLYQLQGEVVKKIAKEIQIGYNIK